MNVNDCTNVNKKDVFENKVETVNNSNSKTDSMNDVKQKQKLDIDNKDNQDDVFDNETVNNSNSKIYTMNERETALDVPDPDVSSMNVNDCMNVKNKDDPNPKVSFKSMDIREKWHAAGVHNPSDQDRPKT